jgi:hypothetical protein
MTSNCPVFEPQYILTYILTCPLLIHHYDMITHQQIPVVITVEIQDVLTTVRHVFFYFLYPNSVTGCVKLGKYNSVVDRLC